MDTVSQIYGTLENSVIPGQHFSAFPGSVIPYFPTKWRSRRKLTTGHFAFYTKIGITKILLAIIYTKGYLRRSIFIEKILSMWSRHIDKLHWPHTINVYINNIFSFSGNQHCRINISDKKGDNYILSILKIFQFSTNRHINIFSIDNTSIYVFQQTFNNRLLTILQY